MCVFVVVSGQDPFVFVGEGEEEERWNTFLFSNKEKKETTKGGGGGEVKYIFV